MTVNVGDPRGERHGARVDKNEHQQGRQRPSTARQTHREHTLGPESSHLTILSKPAENRYGLRALTCRQVTELM